MPIDLDDSDGDDLKENKPKSRKIARDKTATPPIQEKPKKQKKAEELYMEIDSEPEKSLGRSSPAGGANGKKGAAEAQVLQQPRVGVRIFLLL